VSIGCRSRRWPTWNDSQSFLRALSVTYTHFTTWAFRSTSHATSCANFAAWRSSTAKQRSHADTIPSEQSRGCILTAIRSFHSFTSTCNEH